jgi:hypothetical protein
LIAFSFPLSARNCHKVKKYKCKSSSFSFNLNLNPFIGTVPAYKEYAVVAAPTYVQPVFVQPMPYGRPIVEQRTYYPSYQEQVIIQRPTIVQQTYAYPQSYSYWAY